MRILITGATGFIGQRLLKKFRNDGIECVILARNPESAQMRLQSIAPEILSWDGEHEAPPRKAFDRIDAVIHLAGEPIAEHRWSNEQKVRIYNSRVAGTRHLIEAFKSYNMTLPKVFISASAVGYYGDRGNEILDETSFPGKGFLSQVCQAWEKEASEASILGIRTVILRFGMTLSKEGGALSKLLPVFSKGLGGVIGSGKSWASWIHIDDLISIISLAVADSSIRGVYNAVAPEAVTNTELTKCLAEAIHRPAVLTVPVFGLKFAYGEMASVLLDSQRVVPARILQEANFQFRYGSLPAAFQNIFSEEGS